MIRGWLAGAGLLLVALAPTRAQVPDAARTKGSPSAPVTVYEMSDFQCPYCRQHAVDVFPLLDLSDDTFLSMAKIVASAVLRGARVVEIPARLTTRQFGQSKIKVVQLSFDHMKYFLRLLGRRLAHAAKSTRRRQSAAQREVP